MTARPARGLTWKLGGLWFFALGALGCFLPYYTLYLREVAGLSGVQVGSVAAVIPLMGLATQMAWGQLADRTGSRTLVLVCVAAGTACGYAGMGMAAGFVGLLLATAAHAAFATALVPNTTAVSLALLGDGAEHAFGRVRVWGTLGFGVAMLAIPPLVASERGLDLGVLFPLASAAAVVAVGLALALPRAGAVAARAEPGAWRLLLRHRPFVRLLVLAACFFLCAQGPLHLFPLLVQAQGGGVAAISHMWLLMLALEVPLVAWFGVTHARIGLRGLLLVGAAASGVRWTLAGWSGDLAVVTGAQLLHGVVVWGVILGAPVYVDAAVPARLRSTGQAMLATLGVALPSSLSSLAAGWLVDAYDPFAPARVGGLGALAIAAVLPFVLPPVERPEE